MADAKTPESGSDPFSEFLKTAEEFVATTVDGWIKFAGQDDDAPQIASHGAALKDQVAKVLALTRDRYAAANGETRRIVGDLMRVQAVTGMARGAQSAMRESFAKARFGEGVFSWIEGNFEEIKKLIEEIWSLFGSPPPWLSKVLQIIDQLWKIFGGLLGGLLGRSRSKIMSELSQMEVEFWNELSAHARYRTVMASALAETED